MNNVTQARGQQPPFAERVAHLRKSLRHHSVEALLVTSRENVRYLTGFAGSAGWVLVSTDDMLLITDSRYIEQARIDVGEASARLADRGLMHYAAQQMYSARTASLGFESEHLSFAAVKSLEDALSATGSHCTLQATQNVVEDLRLVKDSTEISAMEDAAVLADDAISYARDTMRCGMSERHLAWSIERRLREHGSEAIPFDIIVASGPNAAKPHAVPGERRLAPGEPIVIDLGATVHGYCSDLTRTLFLEHVAAPFGDVYQAVLSAHCAALAAIRRDMRAAEADTIARTVLAGAGFGEYFTHGLGHGVGLQVHERPTLNSRATDTLVENTVFTIEPGVYLPGQGGVRIEDTAILRDGRAHSLARSDKEDPIVRGHSGLPPD
jgi:Xaa-Pro aminopeptidase